MRKVLCATDLSEAADEALRQADGYCRDQAEAELAVLFVEPPLVPAAFAGSGLPALSPSEIEASRAQARAALEAQVKRAGIRSSRVRLEIAPAGGPVYAEIARRGEAGGFELIVVGGHGATGLTRVLLGSVADKVVRYAHSPVLVARTSTSSGEIIAATDLSTASRVGLGLAAAEATRRKGRLTVVHCLGYPPEMMGFGYAPLVPAPPAMPESRVAQERAVRERIERELKEEGITAKVVVEEGEATSSIARLAETQKAELVVVGASGKTGLARVLLGSVAAGVTHRAPCSVLVARPLPDQAAAPARK
jgi:nucleotide-binding universal stress UspA family protein